MSCFWAPVFRIYDYIWVTGSPEEERKWDGKKTFEITVDVSPSLVKDIYRYQKISETE